MKTLLTSVILQANGLGKARHEKWEGREYLVAPVTMIVPGTLTGNNGGVYYSAEENTKSAPDWNGMPIVVGHPMVNGEYVSARTPQVSKTSKVGRIYETTAPDGVLQAEAWIDVKAANRVDKQIVKDMEGGKALEVSTGLYLQAEEKEGKDSKGRSYKHVAHNYKPDHLAILLDQQGACSIKDGCGLMVNTDKVLANLHLQLLQDSLVRDTLAFGNRIAMLGVNYDKSYSQKMRDLGRQVEDRFTEVKTTGDGVTYNSYPYVADVYDDYVIFSNDAKYWKLGYTEKDGKCTLSTDAPVEVERYTVYEPVANAQADQPERTLEVVDWVLPGEVVNVGLVGNIIRKLPSGKYRLYSKSGKNLGTFDSKEAAEKHEREVEYFKHNSTTPPGKNITNHGLPSNNPHKANETPNSPASGAVASSSQETAMDRAQTVNWLCTNCECWKGKEAVLNSKDAFSDEDLARLKANAEAAARNAQTISLVANATGVKPEQLTADTLKDRIKPVEPAPTATTTPVQPTGNGLGRAKDLREFEGMLPPDAMGIWNSAKAVWQQEKDRLIANLAFGLEGQDRTDAIKWLETKDVPELQMLVKMRGPQQGQQGPGHQFIPNYAGAAGGPVPAVNRHMTEREQNDILPLPGMPGYLEEPPTNRKKA